MFQALDRFPNPSCPGGKRRVLNLNSHWLGHELGHPAHYIHEARAKQEELVQDLDRILAYNFDCYALVHLGCPCFRHPSVESLALRINKELATAETEIAELKQNKAKCQQAGQH